MMPTTFNMPSTFTTSTNDGRPASGETFTASTEASISLAIPGVERPVMVYEPDYFCSGWSDVIKWLGEYPELIEVIKFVAGKWPWRTKTGGIRLCVEYDPEDPLYEAFVIDICGDGAYMERTDDLDALRQAVFDAFPDIEDRLNAHEKCKCECSHWLPINRSIHIDAVGRCTPKRY